MNSPTVCVDFRIIGDDFLPSKISDILCIKPNYQWKKGDVGKETKHIYSYSCWALSTGHQISLDVNDQISLINNILIPQLPKLLELSLKYNYEYRFEIVINLFSSLTPGFTITNQSIELAHKLEAKIDIDLYVY